MPTNTTTRPVDLLTRRHRLLAAARRSGRWLLIAIVLTLALIGFLHLTRGTAVRHVRGVAGDGVPLAVSAPEFPLMAPMATGAWLTSGNHVDVLLNGDGTYPRLWDDLRGARRLITIERRHRQGRMRRKPTPAPRASSSGTSRPRRRARDGDGIAGVANASTATAAAVNMPIGPARGAVQRGTTIIARRISDAIFILYVVWPRFGTPIAIVAPLTRRQNARSGGDRRNQAAR